MIGIELKDPTGHIYDSSYTFAVDNEFAHFWERRTNKAVDNILGPNPDGIRFGRRVLECAWMGAFSAKDAYKSHIIRDWKKVAQSSKKLGESTSKFFIATGFAKQRNDWMKNRPGERLPQWIGAQPLQSVLSAIERQESGSVDFKGLRAKANAVHDALLLIEEFSQKAAQAAVAHAKSVAATHVNVGNPEVREFAAFFAEAIAFLMERRPAHNSTEFHDLLAAAWSDICDREQESWERPARFAIERLDDSKVNFLVLNGPDWMLT